MKNVRYTTEQFIEKAIKIHGDLYDYSEVVYTTSVVPVNIRCKQHGVFKQRPNNHLSMKRGCPVCGKLTRKQTCLERYGVDNPMKDLEILQKSKSTNLFKYGHENCAHGTNAEKVKSTMMSKYGTEHFTNPRKAEATNLVRYGYTKPTQRSEVKDTVARTLYEKYDVTNANYVKNKHILLLDGIFNRDWLTKQYVSEHKSAIQIASELGVSDVTVGRYLKKYDIDVKYEYHYSYKCISWLEYIMKQESIVIQHAGNGGEYCIPDTKYKADGFCKETNTIYEFHGDFWHGNPKLYNAADVNTVTNTTFGHLYERTQEKVSTLEQMGFNVVQMWESDFTC